MEYDITTREFHFEDIFYIREDPDNCYELISKLGLMRVTKGIHFTDREIIDIYHSHMSSYYRTLVEELDASITKIDLWDLIEEYELYNLDERKEISDIFIDLFKDMPESIEFEWGYDSEEAAKLKRELG